MSFSTSFRNLGHYFAIGAKAIATGVTDVVKFANKAQAVEPEVDALVAALAGPAAAKISDLAFHVLGSTAAALTKVGEDANAQTTSVGLNITLDSQTVIDVRAAAAQIEAIFKALGVESKPTA